MWKKFWQRDSFPFGMLVGAVIPVITYLLLDLIDRTILEIAIARDVPVLRTNIIPDDTQFALAVAGNLFFFRRYMVKRMEDRTGKGILLTTFAYVFLYLILFFMIGITRIKILSP